VRDVATVEQLEELVDLMNTNTCYLSKLDQTLAAISRKLDRVIELLDKPQ
jgi:hypothetical protein